MVISIACVEFCSASRSHALCTALYKPYKPPCVHAYANAQAGATTGGETGTRLFLFFQLLLVHRLGDAVQQTVCLQGRQSGVQAGRGAPGGAEPGAAPAPWGAPGEKPAWQMSNLFKQRMPRNTAHQRMPGPLTERVQLRWECSADRRGTTTSGCHRRAAATRQAFLPCLNMFIGPVGCNQGIADSQVAASNSGPKGAYKVALKLAAG